MLKTAILFLLFASPVFAQDSSATPLAAAGCGSNDVKFDVKTDKKQHPTAQPDPGKALVYVIGDSADDNTATLVIGLVPTRFGLDGNWVGANGRKSYFFFSVDPGDHRLCTNIQSRMKSQVENSSAATSFTAEAGKTYYFRTKTPDKPSPKENIKIVPVDPAEAQVLISASAFSTFHPKK